MAIFTEMQSDLSLQEQAILKRYNSLVDQIAGSDTRQLTGSLYPTDSC